MTKMGGKRESVSFFVALRFVLQFGQNLHREDLAQCRTVSVETRLTKRLLCLEFLLEQTAGCNRRETLS